MLSHSQTTPDEALSLRDQLILFLYDYQEKNKTTETINRTNQLLEKMGLLENEHENETLSAILEVINDFSEKSLLGKSIKLRGALSTLLCKYLDINQTTIDQHLCDNHTPARSGLMCNLVMQGLINKAKHERNTNVHDEKPSSADTGQEESCEDDKLAKLRETLHGCILLLFTSHIGEEQDAFSLLTKIYDTKITTRTGLMDLMNDTYYKSTAQHTNSRLFYYINGGLFNYFNIPTEDTCVRIMNTYRTRNQDFRNGVVVDSSSLPKRAWHAVYNLNVAPAIAKCVQEYLSTTLTEMKREAPEPVTEKRALKDILVEKISKYTELVSLESEGLQRVSILKNIVGNAKSENALFHQVKEIYDDSHILSTSNRLRNYIGDALAEFLQITEGQICVQEYHDCNKVFARGGEAGLDYGRVRDTAVCELIDKTAKKQYPAKDKPIESKQVQIGLKDQLILFILAYKEKNTSAETLIRTGELLEKLNLLENEHENETLSAILEVINDFSKTSLLGNSIKLRGALSELLCKRLGISENTVDKSLMSIQAPTQPGLLRNLIMQRLINKAEHERNANVHDEKPSSADTAQEKFSQEKLATLRETLHYHISLLFISDVGEQEEALSFLTEIYRNTSTRADLIALIKKKMKNDAGFTCTDSKLLYYINQAVIGYLKIPEEEFCLAIMNTCRRQNQTPTGTSPLHPVMVDSSTPMMAWHAMYNLSVTPIIFKYFHAVALTEIKTENPEAVAKKGSLEGIMLEKISLYKKQESPGEQDQQQAADLTKMVEKAENEDALFNKMKKIYDDFSDNSFLKTGNTLRSYTGYALAEFFGITAGQVAVQEYHSCKKLLSRGARLDYTDVRDTAIRGLVNKAAKQHYPALAEIKAEAPEVTLKEKLISCIREGHDKKSSREIQRESGLLGTIQSLETEAEVLKTIIDVINDFKTDSLLGMGNTSPLRLEISKLLCEHLDITEDSIQNEQKKNNEQKPVFIMHRLINKKDAEDRELPYELVRLREILDRHLAQFLTIRRSRLSATVEEKTARELLPCIYKIPSAGDLVESFFFFGINHLRLDSELFASINEALYEYFNIPAAVICKLMIKDYSFYLDQEDDRVLSPKEIYHRRLNTHMVSLIDPLLTKQKITWESTPIVKTTLSLSELIKTYIAIYKGCYLEEEPSSEIEAQTNRQITNLMITIQEKEIEGETAVFNEMIRIFNNTRLSGTSDDALYKHRVCLAIERTLLEYLGITDDDICIRQFQDCKQTLKDGPKNSFDFFLRKNRTQATHKLINEAAQARQDIEEMRSTLTNRLMCSIGEHGSTFHEQKDQESINRINELLKIIMENAVKDEAFQLKWCAETFNNYTNNPLLSGDLKLCHLMGKALCEELGIKRESSFLKTGSYNNHSLYGEIEGMQELIREAYLIRVVKTEVNKIRFHLPG